MKSLLTIVGVIVTSVMLWGCILFFGAMMISGVLVLMKPKYDTTPIYCERELPNSEH
jgi:hypothetical protein